MTAKNVWIVYEQAFYQDCGANDVLAVFETKNMAEHFCRNAGFEFNAKELIFLNEKTQKYRRVDGFKMNSCERVG